MSIKIRILQEEESIFSYLCWIDLSKVSEGVVKTPGEVERKKTEHERSQHNDYHLHRLLLRTLG